MKCTARSVVGYLVAAACALLVWPAPSAFAQGDSDPGFSGSFLVGLRSVDVGGAERKFREDLDLDDGPRLFGINFEIKPEGGLGRAADRIYLDAANLGGDPYETLSFGVSKQNAFDFTFDRRESTYFYNDVILPPALASIPAANGGDFHTFDFERVRDRAGLDIRLSPAAKLFFGLDRTSKRGEATTTLDVSRDEFELDRIVDESLHDSIGRFEYAWDRVTLILEERVRDYENLVELFLPGQSLGEDPDDQTVLDFFFLDQPYDLSANRHSARLIVRPNRRVDIVLSAIVDDAEIDVHAEEQSQGTAFNGAPLATDVSGSGEIERDTDLFDVDLTYRMNDRFALVGGVYRRELDQDGALEFDLDGRGRWSIETVGGQVGLETFLSPTLTVSAGVSIETREVTHALSEDGSPGEAETEETDREGFFATVAWRPSSSCQVTLSGESNSFDDPFTLSSATDRQRWRLRGRYRWDNGLSVSGVYQLQDSENDLSGWSAESERISLRLGYRRDRLSASAGYSLVDIERSIDQLVRGGFRTDLFNILYEAETDFLDGRLHYRASDRWSFGGLFRLYENDGSFGLARDDLRAWVETSLRGGYWLRATLRTVDYDEERFDFDDYDADIAELAIGYRW